MTNLAVVIDQDEALEQRIREAFDRYATGPREQRETLWKAVTDLHAQRSPAQVARMEANMMRKVR